MDEGVGFEGYRDANGELREQGLRAGLGFSLLDYFSDFRCALQDLDLLFRLSIYFFSRNSNRKHNSQFFNSKFPKPEA